jgi:class 3 adenylate cyclase
MGILLFGIPMIFLNQLSEKILKRSKATTQELLKEKVIQELSNFKTRLQPKTYIQHLIQKVHRKLLPEITQDISQKIPEQGFGNNLFNQKLAGDFVKELKQLGVAPLLFMVTTPRFASYHYWYAPELKKQVGEDAEALALTLGANILPLAGSLYHKNVRKVWKREGVNSALASFYKKNFDKKEAEFHRYISRFSNNSNYNDQVFKIFTDYFSRQYLYGYIYSCVSKRNIHGAYSMFITQNSISPWAIMDFACNNSEQENVDCKIVTGDSRIANDFLTENEEISYVTRIPTDFFAHINHWNGINPDSNLNPAQLLIKVTAKQPTALKNQYKLHKLIRFSSIIIFVGGLLLVFKGLLLGFNFKLKIHKKLALVVGIIVVLPVSATGLLSYYLHFSYERILEQHLSAQVENKLSALLLMEDENFNRLQKDFLKLKFFLQSSSKELSEIFNRQNFYKLFPVVHSWNCRFSLIDDQGQFTDFLSDNNNKLIEGILGKYLINQGLAKASGKTLRNLDLTMSFTMGLLENFLTPEIEEKISVNEGTIQREITHTADVSLASLMIVPRQDGSNMILFPRTSNNEENLYKYLFSLGYHKPLFFQGQSSTSDLKSAVRLRRHDDYQNLYWPADLTEDRELLSIFDKALKQKSYGKKVIRNSSGLTISLWQYRESRQGVYAVIGKARSQQYINLAISLIFPFTLGYSILVLLIVSRLLNQLFVEPIEVLQKGINALQNSFFGLTIIDEEIEEFAKVTNAFNEMSIALKQKQLIGRYVSDRLLKTIEKSDKNASRSSEKLIVSVLASDIRGFTSITESQKPFAVVEMLNSYFTQMEEAILKHSGTIDKYIGDAIQAVFYPDSNLSDPAIRACKAAIDMRKALNTYNQMRREAGKFVVDNGIGIASGTVISGTIGSETGRQIFTVTGEVTGIAAALEAISPATTSKIVICPSSYRKCKAHFRLESYAPNAYQLMRDRNE